MARLERDICEFLDRTGDSAGPLDDRLATTQDRGNYLRAVHRAIGPRYRHCTLDNFEVYDDKQRAAMTEVRHFAENMPEEMADGGGLILLGRPGTGKDHLAAALAKIAVGRHHLRTRWFDGGSLFDDILAAVRSDTWLDLKERLTEPHVLIVSDPNPPRGGLSDAQVRSFRNVIDARYRAMLPTWLTLNVDTREAADKMFAACTMERLLHGATQVNCDWPSYRERKKGVK